jgi:serine protease Do
MVQEAKNAMTQRASIRTSLVLVAPWTMAFVVTPPDPQRQPSAVNVASGTQTQPVGVQTTSEGPAPIEIAPSPAREPVDALSRAAVTLRSAGTLLAQGVVLADDGRIVTCRSALRGVRQVEVRYPNGRTLPATVVAEDATFNLALLQPRTGHWPNGVALAPGTRRGTRATISMGDPPGITTVTFARRRTFVDGDALLRDAWQLDPVPTSNAVGSGVLNERGQLAAVIVTPTHNTSGSAAPPSAFGAPALAIAQLVQRAGDTARPWLGFTVRALRAGETIPGAMGTGLRVLEVANGGPAQLTGLVGGSSPDHIIMADGTPLRVEADLAAVLERHRPGDTITLRVVRAGQQYDVPLVLGRFPALTP